MNINWNVRLRNKAFWLSLVSAIILLAQQLGLTFVPDNALEITNTILLIMTILGVIVDPTTDGLTDSQLTMSKLNKGGKRHGKM